MSALRGSLSASADMLSGCVQGVAAPCSLPLQSRSFENEWPPHRLLNIQQPHRHGHAPCQARAKGELTASGPRLPGNAPR